MFARIGVSLLVCVYVCMYVCMYTHVCMYMCMYLCMCVCVFVCMYVCVYLCMHVCFTRFQLGSTCSSFSLKNRFRRNQPWSHYLKELLIADMSEQDWLDDGARERCDNKPWSNPTSQSQPCEDKLPAKQGWGHLWGRSRFKQGAPTILLVSTDLYKSNRPK